MVQSRFHHRRGFLTPEKKLRLVFFFAGGLLFGVLPFLLFALLGPLRDAPIRAQRPSIADDPFTHVTVLVPTDPIHKGHSLSDSVFVEMSWPRNHVPEGAVRERTAISGMYALVDLQANYPVTRSNIGKLSATNPIAQDLPGDRRAITIEVDASAGIGGWATPGAKVDVLYTFRDAFDKDIKGTVVVYDATVVSFNGKIDRTTSSPAFDNLNQRAMVTLAVSVDEAIRLKVAAEQGRISLMLRGDNDVKFPGQIVISSDELTRDTNAHPATRYEGTVTVTTDNGNNQTYAVRGAQLIPEN